MLRHNSISEYVAASGLLVQEINSDIKRLSKQLSLRGNFSREKRSRIVLLFVSSLVIILSLTMFGINSGSQVLNINNHPNSVPLSNTGQITEGVSQNQKDTTIQILDGYSIAISFFSPIFDSFIGETPDPTGKVEAVEGGYRYNPVGNSPLQFRSGDDIITVGFNASQLSNALLSVAGVVLTLLIVIRSINIITDESGQENQLKPFLSRTAYTVIMLILTPHILGLSIYLNNIVVRSFTSNSTLTGFLDIYLTDLKNQIIDSPTSDSWWSFANILNPSANLLEGIISTLPLNLALLLIIILFLYISFQFVIRFINLFFLSVIYPLVVIFYLSEKTSNIPANYWKIWIGFLIHQPAFILGFIIVQQILNDALLTTGPQPQLLIFFLGMLLFLATINIVVSRIWAESFSAISTNIQAGIGTKMALGAARWTAGRSSSMLQGLGRASTNSGGNSKGIASGKIGKSPKTEGSQQNGQNLKVKHKKLYNSTKSTIGQNYKEQGFTVSSVNENKGILGISGDFYKYSDPASRSNVYYTSEKDAQADGVQSSDLTKENITLRALDTSNRQARQAYNMDLSSEAAKNNIPQKQVRITQSPSEDRINNNLNLMKNKNKKSGIEGIAVSRYPKNSQPGDGSKQIFKIYKQK